MEFVENKGQWHSNVDFKGDFKTGAFFLENKGFTVVMHNPEDIQRLSATVHGHGAQSGSTVTDKSSTAKSLPARLLLSSYKLILAQLPVATNVYTTSCQPAAGKGAKAFPEIKVKEVDGKTCIRISACVAMLVTVVAIDFIQ